MAIVDSDTIVRILSVQPAPGDNVYLLLTVYPQSNPSETAGQILLADARGARKPTMILSASDPLMNIWSSPTGNIWSGSAAGYVWTSTPLAFTAPPTESPMVNSPDPLYQFGVTRLPKQKSDGTYPNITCLFGFSDTEVYAGTFSGAIYHWDGSAWTEMPTDAEATISEIHGTSTHNLFASGDDLTILKRTSEAWKRVRIQGTDDDWSFLTGLRVRSEANVYACDIHGRIYKGNEEGFGIAYTREQGWYGVAILGADLFLASNPGGAWRLDHSGPTSVKANFNALDIYEAAGSLFFIEAEQHPRPSIIVYNPNDPKPWSRVAY